jgi:hypothetical protein
MPSKLICESYRQLLRPDTKAKGSVMRRGHDAARHRRCNSGLCHGKLRGAILRDKGGRSGWLIESVRNVHEDWRDAKGDSQNRLKTGVSIALKMLNYQAITLGAWRESAMGGGRPPRYVATSADLLPIRG